MTTATAKIMNQFERRPTYNELVEMVEEEELKVKPSIENVIDRKASIFRNNQYGGRFDNPDLVGLQKQEQMRQLQMMKQATMREAMIADPDRLRFGTQTGFQTPATITETSVDEDFMLRMEQELNDYIERQRQQREFDRSDADEMLSIVSSQQLPEGVEQFMIDTPSQTFQPDPSTSSSSTDRELPPLEPMDEVLPNAPSSSSQVPPSLPAVEDSRIFDKIKELHPNMMANEQLQAYRILNDVKDKNSRAYANNITSMSNTVERLTALELISQDDFRGFEALRQILKEAKGVETKNEIREEIGRWYNTNVYLKYIAPERIVKGARSKAIAKAKQVGKKLIGDALVEGGAQLADSQLQGSGDVVRGVANLFS